MKFKKIKSITDVGLNDIYHLTVHKNRNFFGNNLCLHNCDYRGELKVILLNTSNEDFTINNGDRIAQIVISKYEKVEFEKVDALGETQRGEGGFGSTNIPK